MAIKRRANAYTRPIKVMVGEKKNAKKKYVDPNRPRRWEAILKRIPSDRPFVGAEIGVWVGTTSEKILAARAMLNHIMIDPWKMPEPGGRYQQSPDGIAKNDQTYFDDCYQKTLDAVKEFGTRAIIVREKSLVAVNKFGDKTLDYVFIDAEHTYEAVKEDIAAWLPKVRPGGWLGGHDIDNLPRFPGVRKAVEEIFGDSFEVDGDHTWFVRVAE